MICANRGNKEFLKVCRYNCYSYSQYATSFAREEIGLELNADKTKYMVMSRDRNAGRSNDINIYDSSFERVEQFRYLGITLTHQDSVQEEIKCSLKSGNACYHSVQNLLSSSLLIPKYKNYDSQNYNFACFFVDVELGRLH